MLMLENVNSVIVYKYGLYAFTQDFACNIK